MAQTLVFRGVAAASGGDPVDRIIVTASIVISTPTETALSATLGGAYSASCVVSSVKYTRASTGAVVTVSSPGSVTVTFNDVQPGADNGERTCSALIPPYGPALYTGTAYAVVYDDVVPYSAPPGPISPSAIGDGLYGKYYNNRDLTGVPVATRVDPLIDMYSFTAPGSGPPNELPTGVNMEDFSIRWSGQVQCPTAGNVQFRIAHNNGVRLYIDGTMYIDQWADPVGTHVTTSIAFTAGQKKAIWIEFFQARGNAGITMEWKYPGQDWQVVPTANMFSGEGTAPVVAPPLRQSRTRVSVINRYPEA